jgi:hypothetical protein
LAEVLEKAIGDADLTVKEAEALAINILRENACLLYHLNHKSGSDYR